jgi:hypothetical protein
VVHTDVKIDKSDVSYAHGQLGTSSQYNGENLAGHSDILVDRILGHHDEQHTLWTPTYHCAIAEDAWRACLDRLGIDSKAQEEILLTAVKAICIEFSSMVNIRYGSLNNMHSRNSLLAPQAQRDHNPYMSSTQVEVVSLAPTSSVLPSSADSPRQTQVIKDGTLCF